MSWTPDLPPAAASIKLLTEKWIPRTRTSVVESELRQQAVFAGVEMIYGRQESLVSLLQTEKTNQKNDRFEFSLPDFVICCDGAKSSCRTEINNLINQQCDEQKINSDNLIDNKSEFRVEKNIGSLIQVKFDGVGHISKSSGKLSMLIKNLPADKQFFNILIGNFDAENCCTPITLFALISSDISHVSNEAEDTSEMAKGPEDSCSKDDHGTINNTIVEDCSDDVAGYEEDLHDAHTYIQRIDIDGLEGVTDSTLRRDLELVLHRLCPEGIVSRSLKVSVLPMAYKVARTVAATMCGIPVFLAGDAALGLPLEKGLNFGWRIASRLCRYISFCENSTEIISAFDAYFSVISDDAIKSVTASYANYLSDVKAASIFRALLKPFVPR